MIILQIEQQTAEWEEARIGVPTASCFDKIVTTKGEDSKQAQKYMYQLAGEKVAGFREEGYTNGIMQRGIEIEAEARSFYELRDDVTVQEVGICFKDDERKYGCSPDGLVGEEGMVEFKCPIMSTHVGYLLDNCLPTEYFQQVQGQLFITGRKWCDFVSYYPGLKPLVVRVLRDEEFIAKLEEKLNKFCIELQKTVEVIS